jgi:hypothetical protein
MQHGTAWQARADLQRKYTRLQCNITVLSSRCPVQAALYQRISIHPSGPENVFGQIGPFTDLFSQKGGVVGVVGRITRG